MALILLINDEPDLLEMCEIILESAGHSAVCVIGPTDALQLARDNRPDVVVLDLVMPVMSGEAVLRRLRKDPRTADTPVVIMSALSDVKERAEDLGADGFLAKPFDPDGLVGVVERVLALAAAGIRRRPPGRRPSKGVGA